MVATLLLDSFFNYSFVFVTNFSFVSRQNTLSGWGRCFLPISYQIAGLMGRSSKILEKNLGVLTTAHASLSNAIPLPSMQLDETGG